MDVKQLGGVRIKDADKGQVSAVFSTFNVVDHDGDVTLPGAFTDGAPVRISAYGHKTWEGLLPVGKGAIRTTDREAILEGQFFMDTQAGRDTFQVVKEMGDLQEWSYGYDVLEGGPGVHEGRDVNFLKRLQVHEVSPVLLGAGIGTRTLATKSHKKGAGVTEYRSAIKRHTTGATNREWDEAAMLAGVADGNVTELRSLFAWVDPAADPELKSSYRFAHHHGVDGPANIRALMKGIAVLNGALGGWSGSEAERKAIYDHLAGHLRDADWEPPELRPLDGDRSTLGLPEKAYELLDGMSDFLDHARRQIERRAEKGKRLPQVNQEALEWVAEDLHALAAEYKALLRRHAPREAVAEEFVRFLSVTARR